ncbi:MAG: peptide-methionine (S)-S-oxide reductase MsrA [Cellvibrionaceae bacterium]
MWRTKLKELVTPDKALPGREESLEVPKIHFVNGNPLKPPFPEQMEQIVFGMGCFWGVERRFWQLEGVYSTAVGYAAGITPNPTYEEVCTGYTGHNEVVLVVFDPSIMTLDKLLTIFWESHDPTQGMRQGNDTGTQYRSGIYCVNELQQAKAVESKQAYQQALTQAGKAEITTEIEVLSAFYYAEEYHQQYLAKNPDGYCGLRGTGVAFGSC